MTQRRWEKGNLNRHGNYICTCKGCPMQGKCWNKTTSDYEKPGSTNGSRDKCRERYRHLQRLGRPVGRHKVEDVATPRAGTGIQISSWTFIMSAGRKPLK